MNLKSLVIISLAFLIYIGFCSVATAQSRFTGSLTNYNAWTFSSPQEMIAGRNNVRLNYLNNGARGRVYLSANLRHHYVHTTDSLDLRLREAYFDVFFENADLRIGKQVVVWGKSDGDFIMDVVSPFDLSEFVTQEFTELREGVTAISYTHFFGRNQIQLLVNPVFEPSRLPEYSTRWSVVAADVFPLPTDFITYQQKEIKLRDTQAALRIGFRPSLNFDLDFGLLYWNSRTPGYFKRFETTEALDLRIPEHITFQENYKPGIIAGTWGEFRVTPSLRFVFEGALFQNRPFDLFPDSITEQDIAFLDRVRQGDIQPDELGQLLDVITRFNEVLDEYEDDGFLSRKPSLKFMAGLASSLFGWDFGLQYSGDIILNYDDEILQESYFHALTTTLNRSFLRDTLMFRFLGRYHINGNDFWLNPEIRYLLTDDLTLAVGSHLFGGKSPDFDYGHLSFQPFVKNNLLFLSASWTW